MAKRRKSKRKRPAPRAKARKVSALQREAKNARERIRRFSDTHNPYEYDIPDIEQFSTAVLNARIAGGESEQSIIAELRQINSKSLSNRLITPTSEYGYKLSPAEYSSLRSAVEQANANIRAARASWSNFVDIMPEEFSLSSLVNGIVNSNTLLTRLSDLTLFTLENLQPIAINEYGEAGTYAQSQYYKNILERENKRRAQREAENPTTQKGYFRIQSDVDNTPIDIASIPSMEMLARRAETWDDPARITRANLFLANYEKALDNFEAALIVSGYYNDIVGDKIERIRDIISKFYNDEQAITFASTRTPGIDISLIYLTGEVNFAEIAEAWDYIDSVYG